MSESRHVEVERGREAILVLAATPAIEVDADVKAIDPCICDDVIDGSWATPTLTSITFTALDISSGTPAATVRFVSTNFVTGGSPCKAYWKLVSTNDANVTALSKNKGNETNTQPDSSCDIDPADADANREMYYDLYWRWTSGVESIDWTLVAADAVFAPLEGDGDTAPVDLP